MCPFWPKKCVPFSDPRFNTILADIKPRFPIQTVVTVFSENRCSENQFSCLFSGPLGDVGSLLE